MIFFLFIVTPRLVVAVQPCLEWIPIEKKFTLLCNNIISFSMVNSFCCYLWKLFSMLQMNFASDARKTAHVNLVTRKYVIMNFNKYILYIYNFWMTFLCFAYSTVQLHMGMLARIICQRCLQLQRNKEIILHLTAPSPPEKTTLKKLSLIRVNFTFFLGGKCV